MKENKNYIPGLPIVTVITVVYNGESSIGDTIKSVINQDYKNLEYIVIDGGSTDRTVEIIKSFENEIDLWVSEPDRGIYDAMNKGTALAKGSWINFMNSGDRLAEKNTLSQIFNQRQEADLLYGNALIEHSDFTIPFPVHPINTIWKKSPFCHQACFVKSEVMKSYKFDLQYKIGADHDLFYRAYKNNLKFRYIPILVCLFDGRDGTTKKRIVQAIQDKKNIAMKYEYSIGKWIYYQFYLTYIKMIIAMKKLLGGRLTAIITKALKNK
ncbi:glycosyltransferase family 2 protein [Ohtaekwangia sp.]|uniref:glycosyltransferase family 2 protein n=1 Tax=Ohtaekwangia sp. TaxID=2066019 RepID=UPI002FDF079F